MASQYGKLVNKQFNSPIKLYSENNIRDVLDRETQMLSNGAVGINFHNPMSNKPANLQNSAVLRFLEEEEQRKRGGQGSLKRVAWPPPSDAEGHLSEVSLQDLDGPQISSTALQNNHAPSANRQQPTTYQTNPLSPNTQFPQDSNFSNVQQPTPYQTNQQVPQSSNYQQVSQSQAYQPISTVQQAPPSLNYQQPSYSASQQHTYQPAANFKQPYYPSSQTAYPQINQPTADVQQAPPSLNYQQPSNQKHPQSRGHQPLANFQQPFYPTNEQAPQLQINQSTANVQQAPPSPSYQPNTPHSPNYQVASPNVQTNPLLPPSHDIPVRYSPVLVERQWAPVPSPAVKKPSPVPQSYHSNSQENLEEIHYQREQRGHQPYFVNQYIDNLRSQQPEWSQQIAQQQQPQLPPQHQAQPQQQHLQQHQPQYQPLQSQSQSKPAQVVEPPPTTIRLRSEAPVSQIPAGVYTSQPATATLNGGKNLRGDLKWPPPETKAQMEIENQARVDLARGPVCRPRRVNRDYSGFFAQHALNSTYPKYKIPPGTQFYASEQ